MATKAEGRVAVVIPTWRRGDLLANCLQSLARQSVPGLETIVVSNGAGEEAVLAAQSTGSTLINMASNHGFAAAVNAGIAAAGRSASVLVLNDDVELDPNWLERTLGFLEQHPEISYCCGKIYQSDGLHLDNAGDALSLGGSAWRLGFGRKNPEVFDHPRPVWAVSGTATLFRREVFDRVGPFDETFFAYLEDMDWSLRAARAGFRGFYLPEATCRHRGGASLGGPDSAAVLRLLTQNQLLLLAKHFPVAALSRLAHRILWAQLLWALLSIRKRRWGAYLAGLAGFFRRLPRAVRSRTPWRSEDAQAFLSRLKASEREIHGDVLAPDRREHNTFWKLYFGLFPLRGDPKAAKQGLRAAP